MTAGLAHSPAQKNQPPHFPNFNVDIISEPLGSSRRTSKTNSTLKLFDDQANDPHVGGERAVRAAVSARLKTEIARPQAAQSTAAGRSLDKGDATLTPAGVDLGATSQEKESQQIKRWRLKHTVANVLRAATPTGGKTPGVCKCGTAKRTADGETPFVTFYNQDGKPGIKGVYYCDSPWLCPTCAPRCAAERAESVQRVFDATERKGGQVVFVTLTVRHGPEDSLKDLKKLVTEACRKARQGKPWALAVKRHDIQGVMVGPEVTWSKKAGWHFHLHLAVPMVEKANGEKTAEERAKEAGEWIINRYLSYIRNEGGKVKRRYCKSKEGEPAALREAQDVQVVWRREDLGDYLAKGSGAWEVAAAGATKTRTKNRRIGGMTPWDIAALAGKGDAQAAARFVEYARVMPGTKSCVITKGLADKLGIVSNEDNTESDQQAEEDDGKIVVGSLETRRWHKVLRNGYAADVLRAVGDLRPWSQIDSMVRLCLGEEDSPSVEPVGQPYDDTIWDELCVKLPAVRIVKPPSTYAPGLDDLVDEINRTAVLQFHGNKGRAMQSAFDAHRAAADAAKLPCVFPQFSEIWQALAA
ncbi:protein rep [Rhizobium sp. BR 317]|uniref:protein rep n=1 Tax=Rhizobium sp. BR 317 TaxID=3040015 RepID=UPI0039BF1398